MASRALVMGIEKAPHFAAGGAAKAQVGWKEFGGAVACSWMHSPAGAARCAAAKTEVARDCARGLSVCNIASSSIPSSEPQYARPCILVCIDRHCDRGHDGETRHQRWTAFAPALVLLCFSIHLRGIGILLFPAHGCARRKSHFYRTAARTLVSSEAIPK